MVIAFLSLISIINILIAKKNAHPCAVLVFGERKATFALLVQNSDCALLHHAVCVLITLVFVSFIHCRGF